MYFELLRKIDKFAGPIICRLLLIFKALLSIFRGADREEGVGDILVIKFFGMGSILLASPALRQMKQRYPSAKITLLTLHSNRSLCEILPAFDKVICIGIDGFWKFLFDYARVFRYVCRNRFDIIIDLEFLTNFSAMTTLVITLLLRVRSAIGFNSPLKWRNSIYDINIAFDHSGHITKIYSKVVRSVCGNGFAFSAEPERVALLANADLSLAEELVAPGKVLMRCDLVCVNVNSGLLALNRRWPREYYASLINKLISYPSIAIILIGSASEVAYVDGFFRQLPASSRIVNLCGKTTLKQLIGIFSKTSLLITNDGGPLHLAQILGLSTVSFFGPETPHLYGPLGDRHHVFYEDIYCSPCLNIYNSKRSYCTNNICLKRITPERVMEVIEKKELPRIFSRGDSTQQLASKP